TQWVRQQISLFSPAFNDVNRGKHSFSEGDFRSEVLTRNVVSGSVIRRGTNERQTRSKINTAARCDVFKRYQPLVVIHRQYRVELCIGVRSKESIGRIWTKT